ncbi:hypothetical protein [Arabiibacter massiliensis]|uniref:hypothetical protein n=1 Tax=Arabiibacter massiliensis TaxID=1870985 RepID=UPI0009BC6E47|nr:hypothetical protein [Arabiibacter massiliensis]
MKNFAMRYPVNGTSALQPKLSHPSSSRGTIIKFPAQAAPCAAHGSLGAQRCGARDRILGSELVRSLRYGTAKGRSYDRIAPWQAVVAGIVFAAVALLAVLGV